MKAVPNLFFNSCIFWTSRHYKANTHVYSTDETSVLVGSYMNGIRSSRVSCQFPGLSSTLTCSCKCSTGPSGKPCPKSGCAAWSAPSPTMDPNPVWNLLNTDTKDELSSQTKSTDHWCFPTRMYSMCFYTNDNTHTFWTRYFYMVAQRVVFADFVYFSFSYRFCIFLCIKESWRHLEDEGHEIRSRVEQQWTLGISHRALALAPWPVSLHLKASVSCKHTSGKHSVFCKSKTKQK